MQHRHFWLIVGVLTLTGSAAAEEATPNVPAAPSDAVVNCYDPARGIVQHLLKAECHGTIVSETEAHAIAQRREEVLKRAVGNQSRIGRGGLRRASFGTAFYVDEVGRLATSYRVVNGCTALTVVGNADLEQSAMILAIDAVHDLALLRVDNISPATPFFPSDDVPGIEAVVAFVGFPDPTSGSTEPIVTTGRVLAIPPPGSPTEQMVIRAEFRDGNSGGPLLDRRGLVIGMVSAKAELDTVRVGTASARDQRNTGLAIPLPVLTDFLDSYDTRYRVAQGGAALETRQISTLAREFVARVDCWK